VALRVPCRGSLKEADSVADSGKIAKNEGTFRPRPPNFVRCPDVIKLRAGLRSGLFALGDQYGDVVLLLVRAEAANGVHERGQ